MQPILTINLSSGDIGQVEIPKDWERSYLGGSSLAARLLYDYIKPDIDPLSAEASLLFLNGPLTGTSGPAVGRFVVCGRSPATGLWGESNCGGFWGVELRKAGFDGLWIQGASKEPVFLWIQDDHVEFRPAHNLWEKDTYETQTLIETELNNNKIHVASIGIAGEAQLPFALILCDHGRVAGRTGMGAIMGAKKLKAIAIQGNGKIPVADEQTYKPLRSQANRTIRVDPMTAVARELGTAAVADYLDYLNEMPKNYFQKGKHEFDELRISGSYIKDNILSGISACHACVIACGRVVTLDDGKEHKGPEYETLVGFGPNIGLNDPGFATRMGELCDHFGIDTISMSNTLGFAYRLYELGLVTEKDTGGLALQWGNAEAAEVLIHQTVHREGFGIHLAKGALHLGKHFNAEQEAVQVNGLELAYHDPRGASGMALVYATSPRGGCHNQSDYFFVDIGQVETSLGMINASRLEGAAKASNVAIHQNWRTLFNALVMCYFSNLEPETILQLVNSACGYDLSIVELLKIGERGWNLKRVINNRLGVTRKNDKLPKPLLQPYIDNQEDEQFEPDIAAMLDAYYLVRGWNPQNGQPSTEKLLELDLNFVTNDLGLEESSE